jgi:hypothetical protein
MNWKWQITFITVIVLLSVTVAFAQYRKAAALEDRLGCAATWLEKAKILHDAHVKDPVSVTSDSRRQLMDQIEWAYGCATRKASHSRIAPGGESFGQRTLDRH